MSEETTTALTLLPAKATAKIKPKPSKREIIDALVALKLEERRKEREAKEEERDKSWAALRQVVIAHAKKEFDNLRHEVASGYHGLRLTLHFDTKPAHIEKLMERVAEAETSLPRQYFDHDIKRLRSQITQAIEGSKTDRVKLMLETPAIRKGLQAILDDMNGEKPAVEA